MRPRCHCQKGKSSAAATSAEQTCRACSYTMAAVTRSSGSPCSWLIHARPMNMKMLPGM